MFRRRRPAPPSVKVPDEKSPKGLEVAVNEEVFDRQYGLGPEQPDDKSRVWGVNSLPASGGKASGAVPQQS